MLQTAHSPTLTPRTLSHAVTYPRLKSGAGAYVVIENGEDLVVIDVPDGWTRVGRSFTADIELDDPTVSRRHARLIKDEDGVRIVDDGSENGVYVNGVRTTGCMLRGGDRIQVGRVQLRFVVAT